MATITAPQKITVDSLLWSHTELGNITCVAHAGSNVADTINGRTYRFENGLITETEQYLPIFAGSGMWERMTPQEIAMYQYAVRDLPLWGDYPCDSCRTLAEALA